ncbi:MAG: hypothetical protein J6V18_08540 [Bacteroidales bacterium]|nr:hypothetical protein [Bacteroidales bacterium]
MRKKVFATIILVAMGYFGAKAQTDVDFPQLEAVSPFGISLEGNLYQKGDLWVDAFSASDEYLSNMPVPTNSFFGGIGIDYTFNRANKLSYIVSLGLELKPIFSFKNPDVPEEHLYPLDFPNPHSFNFGQYLNVALQYQNTIGESDVWFYNIKAGMRFSYYDGEMSFHTDAADGWTNYLAMFSIDAKGNNYNLVPSLMLSAGASFNTPIGLWSLNLVGNISIPKLNTGKFGFHVNMQTFQGDYSLSGNYVGLTLSYSPLKIVKPTPKKKARFRM